MQGDNNNNSPMQRFEDLAKRLFSRTKEEAEKIEREGEILADEIIEQPKPMPDE